MTNPETRTDTAARIIEEWLDADYSTIKILDQKLNSADRRLFRAALTTIATHAVTEGERRIEKGAKTA